MPAEIGPDEWEPQTACWPKTQDWRRTNLTWDYQPLRAVSIFNRYVDLIRILNDAISEPISEELCIQRISALGRWYDQLPEYCAFLSPSGRNQLKRGQGLSPQLTNLHLAFMSTEMFLKTQKSSIPRYGSSPSTSTPGSQASFTASAISLVSAFATKFGVSTMPAIFTSYKAICERNPTKLNFPSLNPNPAESSRPGNYHPLGSSSDSAANHLPTRTEHPEYVVVGGNDAETSTGLSSSGKVGGGKSAHAFDRPSLTIIEEPFPDSQQLDNDQICSSSIVDTLHEHEKEAWKGLFDIVEVGEAGASNFSYHGDLDRLNGMEW
jgi:hypothetical protein